MEGKNCFQTKWSQSPLYSGGNIASLQLPTSHEVSSSSSSLGEEILVMTCGDTVNALRASTGDLLASYKLPLEDVILRVDAVSILPPEAPPTDTTNHVARDGKKRRVDKVKEEEGQEDRNKTEPRKKPLDLPLTAPVPPGSYIAIGTRTLQVYVLRLDCIHEKEEVKEPSSPVTSSTGNNGDISCVLTPLRSWTAAQQAIAVVQFTFSGRYLVSGSTDGGVKVWDVFNHHLTHNLRTPSANLVHSVYVDPAEKFICVGSFEGHVAIFDFVGKTLITHGHPHVSAVEALCLTPNNEHVFSIGRDRKLVICAVASPTLEEVRSFVVKEHVSTAVFESPFRLHIGAVDGTLSTYRVSVTEPLRLSRRMRGHSVGADGTPDDEWAIRSLLVVQSPKGMREAGPLYGLLDDGNSSSLYAADAAFNISLLRPDAEGNGYHAVSTLVGFLDQVLDIKPFPPGFPFQRVVVTNSKDVRCYSTSGCLSSQTLRGHDDIVLTCAVSADAGVIATAGKDREVRFWSTTTWETVAIGRGGHDADITAISFNTKQSESYMVLFSVGVDENLRLWDAGVHIVSALPQAGTGAKTFIGTPPVVFSHRSGINAAHEGAIHALAVAPNDQYVATAGKDKNVNLWNITGKKLFRDASLKGHRRAVSCLAFSPSDRVLASASNDGSIRLWSLISLTCVKTLQVDRTPVLQVVFFNGGTQLVTGNAEGVLRVWAIAESEVVWSGETHEGGIWALSVVEEARENVLLLSGSADGVLVATEDYTSEEAERVRQERHDVILKEQELANALHKGQYTEAFMLALRLNHPRNLRQVIMKWSVKDPEECEASLCRSILPSLNEEQLLRLLQFTREWVTNARYCGVASLVMHSVLVTHHFTELAAMPAVRTILEALLAYMQRHSQRLHEVLRRTYYIDYVTRSLGPLTLTSEPPFLRAATNVNGWPQKRQRSAEAV
ncbi:U3 small nucleolar RNA-associated protein 13 [Trypanosoma rangeli]|uniref:U3 small nucleolar RNA-associated protein 13 n=1 Tax=Trypanosoma rangeli TaxID=5698 RepID=A0A3S5IS62_TRYRA|nr:U3 small nucleolar RNA-associated protein 13 [Trypanosoma rangeli]RNF10025.1 U3 small nucleolar RNA-associated protein 13 [Trypanosoma rangeli]|eukprot:RNF10025.1 U3 small nucleolar RNA-associated protein 13 [Trypanosoma rangeli]